MFILATGSLFGDVQMFPLLCLLCATMGLVQTATTGSNFCQTVDSEAGICVRLPECSSLYDLLLTLPLPLTQNASDYLKQSFCGLAGRTPKVCCPHVVSGRETFNDYSRHQNLYLLNENTCGLSVEPRVVGGTEAHINEFPWMAALIYDRGLQCGGSIITKRYVLTAANCITNDLRRVRIGELTYSTNPDCQKFLGRLYCTAPYQELGIERTIVHELFSTSAFVNDVALIRVVSPIDFTNPNVMPVCLPIYQRLQSKSFDGKNLTVTGWGFTEMGNKSDILHKVDVKVISNKECKARYGKEHIPAYTMDKKMCAGTPDQDACKGDSGGPLIYMEVYDNNLRYVQHGIVSYGTWACGGGMPGVYVRVSHYLQWILDHIQP